MQNENYTEEKVSDKQIINSRTADSGGKIIFENPELCSQLLRDYTNMDLLKNIRPEDIEDVTERFIPMFTEQRDADVVKKVHLAPNEDFFVTLVEHKSGVDYNVVMQILRYMVYIWEDYEKQQDGNHNGISTTKQFKYPPILPIVYYEGKEKWTVERNLYPKIMLNEPFREFIPDFRYYLINLNDYSKSELINKKSSLAFVMLINSIKNAEEFKSLELPEDYIENLLKNSSNGVLEVIAKVMAVILRKLNVPEDKIQDMLDQVKRRKNMALFDDWEGFDYQIVKNEGIKEGRAEGETKKLIQIVVKKLSAEQSPEKIASDLMEEAELIHKICDVIESMGTDCDIDMIYREMNKDRDKAVISKS
jgi:hypothetical protein